MKDVCLVHYKQSRHLLRSLLSIPDEDSYCSKKSKVKNGFTFPTAPYSVLLHGTFPKVHMETLQISRALIMFHILSKSI